MSREWLVTYLLKSIRRRRFADVHCRDISAVPSKHAAYYSSTLEGVFNQLERIPQLAFKANLCITNGGEMCKWDVTFYLCGSPLQINKYQAMTDKRLLGKSPLHCARWLTVTPLNWLSRWHVASRLVSRCKKREHLPNSFQDHEIDIVNRMWQWLFCPIIDLH